MDWKAISRLALYLAGFGASGLALWLSASGVATYDPTTGVFDLLPFDVKQFTTQLVSWVGNGMAALALWRGWKGRP